MRAVATLDLGGQARFGPDVEWLAPDMPPEAIDYAVDPARSDFFYAAIRRLAIAAEAARRLGL